MQIDIAKVINDNEKLYYNSAVFHQICSYFIQNIEIDDNIIMNTIIKLCETNEDLMKKLKDNYVMTKL